MSGADTPSLLPSSGRGLPSRSRTGVLLVLPVSMREWLPQGHPAYFISDTVEALDLSEIEAVYEREARGNPPYHPQMMTKVLFYA